MKPRYSPAKLKDPSGTHKTQPRPKPKPKIASALIGQAGAQKIPGNMDDVAVSTDKFRLNWQKALESRYKASKLAADVASKYYT